MQFIAVHFRSRLSTKLVPPFDDRDALRLARPEGVGVFLRFVVKRAIGLVVDGYGRRYDGPWIASSLTLLAMAGGGAFSFAAVVSRASSTLCCMRCIISFIR